MRRALVALTLGLLLGGGASAAPPAPATPAPAPTSASPATHPGTIRFLAPDGTAADRAAASVPAAIAWYTDGSGRRVPVVRVELTDGERREIKRFGVDGALLDVTVAPGRPPAPRP